MTIRTKVWLLVAISVAITAAAAFRLQRYFMRRELMQHAEDSAREIATEVVEALGALDADAEDRDLAVLLNSYMQRHLRIQRLQLLVKRESPLRIVAPRGERLEITRLGPSYRLPDRSPEYSYTRRDEGDDLLPLELPVKLNGPWTATLSMQWRLGSIENLIQVTERWVVILDIAHLMALVLISLLIIDRVVVRRLEILAAAMRDVEGGDLERRVPVVSNDEVGRLSQGFNRMLERLGSADKEIRAFSQRLANEIEAATQDLSRKNLALAQVNRLLNDLRRENASKVRLATLGQLAAQLAHEIGTPLSSVSGHLQLALLQRDLPAGLRERLDVATREIGRIGRIVRDYLDSTRSLEPEKKVTSLSRVLAEAVEVTRGVDVTGRSMAIDTRIEDDPADFVTDPGLLRQIVINLLSNALDAIESGGRVTLSTKSDPSEIRITVSDDGLGISPEDLRRIFEPFYTTKGRGKGTGLGLAICRELTAALGGSISVESTPGRGSTFTLRVPRFGSPERREPEQRPAAAGGLT
jgi:signal transduction histidine kinase